MAGVHHTRVYGGLTDCRPWLAACVQAGFIPDILFTVGRDYVVATSPQGDLYIRRSPRGPRAVAKDPKMFTKDLHRRAWSVLQRHMANLAQPVGNVRWSPTDFANPPENLQHLVS